MGLDVDRFVAEGEIEVELDPLRGGLVVRGEYPSTGRTAYVRKDVVDRKLAGAAAELEEMRAGYAALREALRKVQVAGAHTCQNPLLFVAADVRAIVVSALEAKPPRACEAPAMAPNPTARTGPRTPWDDRGWHPDGEDLG
jgi:hypothetical protein